MKLLALDIETAPNTVYTWGLFNQNVSIDKIVQPGYTMCWAAAWLDEPEPVHFRSNFHHGSDHMLRVIKDMLDEADGVITWHGKGFDLPTLNKEFILHRIDRPSPYRHVDLYETVKKQFRFVSNKLDFVSQQLGVGNKVKHKGFDLWTECMDGVKKSWEQMRDYNIQDVILLTKLYPILLPWIDDHPNWPLYEHMDDRVHCIKCGSTSLQRRGYAYTSVGRYQKYRCNDCGSWMRTRTRENTGEEGKLILSVAKT